jgi:hypothetical protein
VSEEEENSTPADSNDEAAASNSEDEYDSLDETTRVYTMGDPQVGMISIQLPDGWSITSNTMKSGGYGHVLAANFNDDDFMSFDFSAIGYEGDSNYSDPQEFFTKKDLQYAESSLGDVTYLTNLDSVSSDSESVYYIVGHNGSIVGFEFYEGKPYVESDEIISILSSLKFE